MAGVKVKITQQQIMAAIATPGGPLYDFRADTANAIVNQAELTAPVNNPANAAHRSEPVGEFQRSFDWNRYGNQHVVGARIFNTSDHAEFAEFGRGNSTTVNKFSAPGDVKPHVYGRYGQMVKGWRGNHTLRDAANAVMGRATGGSVTPLS